MAIVEMVQYMHDIFDHHHLYSMNWKEAQVFLCLYLCPKHFLKSLIWIFQHEI